MIDLKSLENVSTEEAYRKSLAKRHHSAEALDELLKLNQKRREMIAKAETAKADQNRLSQEIGNMKRRGEDVSLLLKTVGTLSSLVKEAEAAAAVADQEVTDLALRIPNFLQVMVPDGKGAEENVVQKSVGMPGLFTFPPKEHTKLGEMLDGIDSDRAAKVTGARFVFLKGGVARLERALIQYMMDLQSEKHGYREILPPYAVNSASLTGTGNFPKFKEDVFKLEGQDFYLIPTAEVPVTNLYAGEILEENDLPQKFCAFSPCFRSEAGSYGRDTKGLIRQHQFHKVELMVFAHPDRSNDLHEDLTRHAELVLENLGLPYRRMLLCGGDTSFGSAKTYDLEVWLPGQQAYREISSCSNFEDFQARRANIRFRPTGGGKPRFVHTLNGSGLAVGRTLVAILENFQREDGSVEVPEVLHPYMSGLKVLTSSK